MHDGFVLNEVEQYESVAGTGGQQAPGVLWITEYTGQVRGERFSYEALVMITAARNALDSDALVILTSEGPQVELQACYTDASEQQRKVCDRP